MLKFWCKAREESSGSACEPDLRGTHIWQTRANLLFLNPSGIMSDAKTTQPNAMESTEEEPVHLPCNHSTISGNEYIYWYRQIPNQGPEYMIRGLKDNVTDGKATLIIAVARESSTLILPRVTLGDAGVYYCILREAQWHRWGLPRTPSAWWGKGSSSRHRQRPPHKNDQDPNRSEVKEKRGKSKVKIVRESKRKG